MTTLLTGETRLAARAAISAGDAAPMASEAPTMAPLPNRDARKPRRFSNSRAFVGGRCSTIGSAGSRSRWRGERR